MKEIQLSHNQIALVDDEDFEILNQRNWFAYRIAGTSHTGKVYLYGFKAGYKQAGKKYWMHNIIMNPSDGLVVDHIDKNPLNNQRSNLRICTKAENSRNRSKQLSPTSSKYIGVHRSKSKKKPWRVIITYNNKSQHVGLYSSEPEAAEAYNQVALTLFGSFANLNEVKD